MDWTELVISVPVDDIQKTSEIAHMVVPYGIYIEDYSDLETEVENIAHVDLIDTDLLKKDRTKGYVHIYIGSDQNPGEAVSFLTQRLTECNIVHSIGTSNCKMEDWVNNWKKYFRPFKVGEKLIICPLWENFKNERTDRKILKIEPGLAFGTGSHETTRLCIESLEKRVKPGSKILDIGCGSGILSISSLLLGAESAVGVDIDDTSVKTAEKNAEINGVNERFTGICGDLTDNVSGKFDVIVANIVADVLIELNKSIQQLMDRGSIYIISGIIEERETDVLAKLPPNLTVKNKKYLGGWVLLELGLR